jgi:hypothetical protein
MGRKKKMKQEKLPLGTIYQVKEGGNYYLRYQIQGRRKNVNLNTSDYDAAVAEYHRLLPTLQATTVEVVAAHVKNARQLAGRIMHVTRHLQSPLWRTTAIRRKPASATSSDTKPGTSCSTGCWTDRLPGAL